MLKLGEVMKEVKKKKLDSEYRNLFNSDTLVIDYKHDEDKLRFSTFYDYHFQEEFHISLEDLKELCRNKNA